MSEYGAFEAKNKFSELIDRALRGEEVVITRRGKPEVKIVPVDASRDDLEKRRAAFEKFLQTGKMLREAGVKFTPEEIREFRDEGRR